MKEKSFQNNKLLQKTFKPIFFGVFTGFCSVLIFLIIFAFILSFGTLSLKTAPTITALSIGFGSFIAGYCSAKGFGKNGMICGILCGIILFIIFTIMALIITKSAPETPTLIRLIIFLSASAIGGILGVGNQNKRKIV